MPLYPLNVSLKVYFLFTDLSSLIDNLTLKEQIRGRIPAFNLPIDTKEYAMQDYIEDLLDDVEEFDDDIADDYSDI